VLWRDKVVSFEVTFEGVKWWWDSDSSSYVVPDLWSNRRESTTCKVSFLSWEHAGDWLGGAAIRSRTRDRKVAGTGWALSSQV